jgi:hypothetical protein
LNSKTKIEVGMKKIILFITALLFTTSSFSQVFNTGQTLKPKSFSAGFEPALLLNGSTEFILFVHGGYGLKKGIDFGVSIGVLGPNNYIGADVEFGLARWTSFAFGAHHFGSFGLDGTLNVTFPIRKDVRVFSGADLDINFNDDKTRFLLWLPVGVEVGLRKNMSFIFEASIGLTDPAYHLIGGGLNFYF